LLQSAQTVVSLTGGIASGKSTASKLFSSQPHSIPLIDLDLVAREVVEPHDASKTLEKLVKHFGDSILQSDGTLNRPALGRLTFGKENEANRKILNKYTHSAIRKRLAWRVFKYWIQGHSLVIIDTPLAVEAGLWKFCGEMIVVWW
jgi:dephospho-CoA kinase